MAIRYFLLRGKDPVPSFLHIVQHERYDSYFGGFALIASRVGLSMGDLRDRQYRGDEQAKRDPPHRP